MLAAPRVWEAMLTRVEVEIEDSTRLKRWLYHRLLPIGQQMADLRRGQAPSIRRLAHVLAERLILRPVRDRLGLLRARRVYTGVAPLGPEGVPLVPRHRRAAQASVRSDRSQRHLRRASRR